MARIVIVEDDQSLAYVIASSLEGDGHLVKAFHNGLEAQNFILANQADMLVLDWDLPGLSGIEILRDYRAFGGTCPVLMLTGHNQVEDKEAGFESGADDYLTKPFAVKELLMRVKALIKRSQTSIGNVMSLGDIVIDFDTTKVMKSGKAVKLVTRESQLLAYLAKNREESISAPTEEIVNKVWTADAEMTPEGFQTVARRLSKKLDPDGRILRLDKIIPGGQSLSLGTTTPGLPANDEEELEPLLGRILDGKYEIIKAIGGGASGTVFKAKHVHMNVMVAVKVLAPQLSMQPEYVRRFEREARACASLRHNNIIILHDMGMTEEMQPYLVMELLDGCSLAELLEQNNKLHPQEAVEVVCQILQGIACAHAKGLTHRDLKPGNVMMLPQQNGTYGVKIVDFGLAKSASAEEGMARLTQTGALIGTPSYMSPEQCNADPVDFRSDIYSIGCILYELLTGSPPFVSNNLIEILNLHASEPPPPLKVDGIPENIRSYLERVIHTCLAKSKDERFQSSEQMLGALNGLRTQRTATG